MSRYIKRIKGMPIHVIFKKIVRKLYHKIYHEIKAQIIKRKPVELDGSIFNDWSSDAIFSLNYKNKPYYMQKLRELNEIENIIFNGDKILKHEFNLLGSGEKKLGKNIEWNKDFKSGYIWENKYYKKIKVISSSHDGDPKVPWELSRFQHIPLLGQAYWITDDDKYAQEFKNQVNDWICKNPLYMSINWVYAMEVAIRACNWIIGAFYFKKANFEKDFWKKFNSFLYMHADFIYKNLEKGEKNNNHYISDLVGLVWLGIYFKNLNYSKNKADEWLKYGIKELELEMDKQVYDDGVDYEASTAYHCLVTELLLYTSVFCKYNGVYFSEKYEKKLEKMCEFIVDITKPNGLIPLIGDMDSGRFIMFTGYGDKEMRDFRYLIEVAGQYFQREDFLNNTSNQLAALWMFEKLIIPKNKNNSVLKSVSYPQGGIHVLRNKKVYIITRCGANGTAGKGGHTHNDQLSIELNAEGKDFIIDPGTYVYTSDYEKRNLFRSTEYHSTLQIENFEQNRFHPNYLFRMEDETDAKVLNFNENCFEGIHYGFKNKTGYAHKRQIVLGSEKVTINDTLIKLSEEIITAQTSLKYKINFILAEDVKLEEYENGIILKKGGTVLKLEFKGRSEIKDVFISHKYGEIIPSKKITIEKDISETENQVSIIF